MRNTEEFYTHMEEYFLGKKNANRRSTYQEREKKSREMMQKEAMVNRWVQSPAGWKHLGGMLTAPVRETMDYAPQGRNFIVVERMEPAVELTYSRDLPDAVAATIGDDGVSRIIVGQHRQYTIKPFWIQSIYRIPRDEETDSRFRSFDRAKDKVAESMGLREDLHNFGLMDTASTGTHTTVTDASYADAEFLAELFQKIESQRLDVVHILGESNLTRSMRNWQHDELGPRLLEELITTGYRDKMWDANIWINDQVAAGYVYLLTSKDKVGWEPIRQEVAVDVTNFPEELQMGLVASQRQGMVYFNSRGVAKGTFSTSWS